MCAASPSHLRLRHHRRAAEGVRQSFGSVPSFLDPKPAARRRRNATRPGGPFGKGAAGSSSDIASRCSFRAFPSSGERGAPLWWPPAHQGRSCGRARGSSWQDPHPEDLYGAEPLLGGVVAGERVGAKPTQRGVARAAALLELHGPPRPRSGGHPGAHRASAGNSHELATNLG